MPDGLRAIDDVDDIDIGEPQPFYGKGKDNEYPDGSYQRLYEDRVSSNPKIIFDMMRHAKFEPKMAEAVTEAYQLGIDDWRAPCHNRIGTIQDLEMIAEALVEKELSHLDEDDLAELDDMALQDVKNMVKDATLEGFESEYYGVRRRIYKLKSDMQAEREAEYEVRDYTLVKDMITAGRSLQQVMDLLPEYWQYCATWCVKSVSVTDVEREHIVDLMNGRANGYAGDYEPAPRRRGRGIGNMFKKGNSNKSNGSSDSW